MFPCPWLIAWTFCTHREVRQVHMHEGVWAGCWAHATPLLQCWKLRLGKKRKRREHERPSEKEEEREQDRGNSQWPGRRNSEGCPEWVSLSEGSLQCSTKQQQRGVMRKRIMTFSWCFYPRIVILSIRDGSSFLFPFSACETISPGWSMLIGHRCCTSM